VVPTVRALWTATFVASGFQWPWRDSATCRGHSGDRAGRSLDVGGE
jgi:hypothetical protein